MLPSIAVAGQDKLIRSLESKFSFLESVLSSPANQNRVHRRATQRSILLARLLQYDLGFPGIWTPCPKAVGANLCSLLFRLLLVSLYRICSESMLSLAQLHGAGETLDVLAYSVMIDTLFYLLDGIRSLLPTTYMIR
jgi:mediator of RNA polymerase II transcription subunit 12